LAQHRLESEASFNLDAFERWGKNSNWSGLESHIAMANERPKTEAKVRQAVATLREAHPEALNYWIDGQIQLLDAFLETSEDETGQFVANSEKVEWESVRAGSQDFVHQNTYYISQDPELFESLFGFPPTAP